MLADNPRFRVQHSLGTGGFGLVYEAFDLERHARVAVKFLRRSDPGSLLRLKREFRALADLSHVNLVALYELVADQDPWFIAMELVDGSDFISFVKGRSRESGGEESTTTTLARSDTSDEETGVRHARIVERPSREIACDLDRLQHVTRQLAEALTYLHHAGKLHCDIKPSNVLVRTDGIVKLLDFGLTSEFGLRTQTERGQIIGTPAYMSPEQGLNEPLSESSDWYSVGVMLFEALTGRRPFSGTYLEVLRAKEEHDGPAPGQFVDDIPEGLADLCEELLAREPEMRPGGAEVIARLNRLWPQGRRAVASVARLPANVFVGRDRELITLVEARSAVRGGHAVLTYVHGSSGIGKTALVGRFLDRLRAREPDAAVLTGRCYERESISYKALDNIVDELSHYLRRLGTGVEELVPRDAAALARLFPILRRVEPIALSRDRSTEIADFQELRRRGFAAFRELLSRLAASRLVVLFIDDLHWGDVDSAALLTDLLRPPDAPPLLLIASYRTEEAVTSAALKVLLPRGRPVAEAGHDVREIALGELTVEQARDLTTRLLGEPGRSRRAEAIVHESGRSPFLIGELVRYAAGGGAVVDRPAAVDTRRADPALTLETVLREQTSRLTLPAQRLLEVLAVFGRPLRTPLASQAARLGTDEIEAVTALRTAHLVRTRVTDAGSAIEVYHDRIRETVVSHLEPEAMRAIHSHLAFALDAQRDADPETLLTHFEGAGLRDRAAAYALEAANRARDALAFDHAAKLYRTALDLGTFDEAARRNVQVMLGDALAAGGRGHDAAEAYLQAASGAVASRALELKRRAAEQLLRSGHLDEGYRAVRDVLDAMGLKLAESPARALLSLLRRRLRVRLRGLEFRARDESQIPAEALVRVDACWTVATALGVVDMIRGADFQGRHLLLALETGDRYRIARALAVEAVYAAVEGAHRRERHEALIARADALAREVGHPQAIGLVAMARGAAAFLLGSWKSARELLERAEPVLREQAGAWQIDTHLFHLYYLLTLFNLGDVGELGRRLPRLIDEARERDDITAATNLLARASHIRALAADDPRGARDGVDAAMARWPKAGFHAQHSWELYARGEIDLYDGRGGDAWQYVSSRWPALRRSMLLRIQGARIESIYLRARAAVAAAAVAEVASARRKLLSSAERDARRLARESAPWAAAAADFIHGGTSAVRGDLESALHRFERAERAFHSVDMALHAMVARRRRGQLTAGGTALIRSADDWMATQSIRNPARMADMLAPGPELFSRS